MLTNSSCLFCETCRSLPIEESTSSSEDQVRTESKVADCFNAYLSASPRFSLVYDNTVQFLRKGLLKHLSSSYTSLDASRPWICYWILHSLELLDCPISDTEASEVVDFLQRCKDPLRGGYGGGPGQISHLAPTYAAVCALCTIGTEEALSSIDRASLLTFFTNLHQRDGSMIMHEGGEVDIRGLYCASSVAKLINLDVPSIFIDSARWLASCQSYEGGFSAVPGTEAHGGYTFCGFAALHLLDRQGLCDLEGLVRWLVSRQMSFEGGFSGRANKLVDSCYSFWQVSPLIMAQCLIANTRGANSAAAVKHVECLFQPEGLKEYILLCCQNYGGGLRDKPGASRDYYHTCYALSGLSVAQEFFSSTNAPERCLTRINPVFNICQRKLEFAHLFFEQYPKYSSAYLSDRPD